MYFYDFWFSYHNIWIFLKLISGKKVVIESSIEFLDQKVPAISQSYTFDSIIAPYYLIYANVLKAGVRISKLQYEKWYKIL